MGLESVIRSAIATASSVVDSLKADVQHAAWIGADSYGEARYAARVTRPALIEYKQRALRSSNGEVIVARAKLTFLDEVPSNGAVGRREPIDARDEILLPDGTSATIVSIDGLVDPGTGKPYFLELYLGW